jgi:hypothetical protein
MIANLCLLFLAIAKVLLMTGLGPAIAIAILYECYGVRIVRVGVEKVSAGGQLAERNKLLAVAEFRNAATSPPRKERVCA